MEITQLSAIPGGTPQAPAGFNVLTPVGEPPLRIFRETRYLRFSPGEGAEELLVDPAACRLQAAFETHEYDALDATPPLVATVTAEPSGAGLIVEFDVPRHVFRVRLSPAKVFFGHTLQLHRMDGNTPTEQPSATAAPTTVSHGGWVLAHDGGAPAALAAAALPGPGGTGVGVGTGIGIGGLTPVFPLDFTDRRFLLRVSTADDVLVHLAPADLLELRVRSHPSNPRIGIVFPDPATPSAPPDPEGATFFWNAPGEIGATVPAAAGTVDADAALGSELSRTARRFADLLRSPVPPPADPPPSGPPPQLPPSLEVALVVESDSPCRLRIDDLTVQYRLARESFPAGEEKVVLRFPGGKMETREVELPVPAGATLHSATLELVEGVRGDRGASGAAFGEGPASQTGVRLRPGRAAAQRVVLPQALTATGAALGILPLVAGTALRLEVREDLDGAPAGRVLADGTRSFAAPGRREWCVLSFASPVILSSAPVWLLLSATSGAALWLTSSAAEGVRVLDGTVAPPGTLARLDGEGALYALLSRSGSSRDVPPFSLAVGDNAVEPGDAIDGRRSGDLAPALAAWLAAQPAGGGLLTAPLRCSAVGPGTITVYPPRVLYER